MSRLTKDSSFSRTASTCTSQEGLDSGASSSSSRSLRVTLLSSEWRSTKGGLSTINRELAIQLARHPYVVVSVYLPQCTEEDKRVAASHNVQLIEAEELPGLEPELWLSSIREDHVVDCVIGHGVHLGKQVQLIKRQRNCEWIQVVHTDPEELGMYKSYEDAISKGEKKHQEEVKLCQLADQVVAIGPKLAEAFSAYLRFCGKDQEVLNFTPSIFTEFVDVTQATEERKTFRVLVFGRGDSEDFYLKGYDIAAQAIAELKGMPCKLVFVGAPSGEEERVAERLLKEGIGHDQLAVRRFNESRKHLAELFCEVDLAIMPSRTEGFGLAALEALSGGLPVLVSGNSGLGEALKKVPYGSHSVMDSEDPKEWARAIMAVHQKDRELRLEEAKSLCAAYAKKYSWQGQCERLVERMLDISLGDEQDQSIKGRHFLPPVISQASKEPTHSRSLQKVAPQLPMRMDCEIVPQNNVTTTSQDVLNLVAIRYLQTVKPSTKEEHNAFKCYLQDFREVLIVGVEKGSLIITLECSSLQILEGLWKDYCTGHLNKMAQKCLVTKDILKDSGVLEVKLSTTILEKDYRACQEFFTAVSFNSRSEVGLYPTAFKMASRGPDRRRSKGGKERPAYTRLKKQKVEPVEIEYVAVPRNLKGHVIGKGGCVIKEIIKLSGASISSAGKDDEWFTVSGKEEQRAYAKKRILEKVQEIQRRMHKGAPPGELVDVPSKYKGLVMGTGGDNLRKISTQTGAKVTRKDGEVYIVSGTEEQRQQAKMNINIIIAAARLGGVENEFNKVCCYIDGWNLPEDCYLKLEQVIKEDRMVLPGTYHYVQYRLKPVEDYGRQDSCCSTHDPSYLPKLIDDALESLRKIKDEMKTNEYLKLDMWCQFGKAIIRGPDEEEAAEREWTIDEATQRFRSSDEDYWRTAFNQGVNLDEKILEGNACKKTPEDFIARHDFTFLTPDGHEIRCKVWVARKNVEKQLEDAEVPFGDVKNILDEIHFEDESTKKRCRGWLVLPSRRYLQADILFPGCEFDCRLTIRGRTDSAFNTDYVPKEDARHALSRYLSELTLMDEHGFEICLPQMDIPNGFHLIHKRCSRRSLYEFNDGFAVILSKESSWRSDVTTEESRESTDLHLHCKEWDKLLRTGDWEPDIIAGKIPGFFKFVKSVQDFVLLEIRRTSEK